MLVCVYASMMISLPRQQAFLRLAGWSSSSICLILGADCCGCSQGDFWQQQGTDAQLGNDFLKQWHLGVSLSSQLVSSVVLSGQTSGSKVGVSLCGFLGFPEELKTIFICNFKSKITLEYLMKFT